MQWVSCDTDGLSPQRHWGLPGGGAALPPPAPSPFLRAEGKGREEGGGGGGGGGGGREKIHVSLWARDWAILFGGRKRSKALLRRRREEA